MDLKNRFRINYNTAWSQVARTIKGDYLDGGFWKKDKIVYQHNEWYILVDTCIQYVGGDAASGGATYRTYTRIRAPFISKDNLKLKIAPKRLTGSIGKFFGMQDITLGDRFFDDKFVVKSSNEYKAKNLLASNELVKVFNTEPDIFLEIKNDDGWFGPKFANDVDELYLRINDKIFDEKALLGFIELFNSLLNGLVRVDSAYPGSPNIYLK